MIKKISSALIVGSIAAIAVRLSMVLELSAWVIFIGWVSYFIFANNLSTAALTGVQVIFGLFIACVIIISGIELENYIQGYGLIIAVFLVAGLLTFMEPIKPLNNIPAYYLGMIVMFASGLSPEFSNVVILIFPLILGFLLGWFTIFSRIKLDRLMDSSNEK